MKTLSFFIILTFVLAFVGCDSGNPLSGSVTPETQAIQDMVNNSDSISGFSQSDEALIGDSSDLASATSLQNNIQLSKMGFNETNTHIKVFRWARRISNITKNVSVTVNDTTAIAIITKTVTGNIVISAAFKDTASFPDTIIRKPFQERLLRKVLFHKVANTTEPARNWRPVAISLVEGTTLPDSSNTYVIQSLQVYSPSDTFTVSSPLSTWLKFGAIKRGIPQLRHTDSLIVRVTLFSTNDSAETVFSRWNGERNNFREKMTLVSTAHVSGGYERVFQMNVRTHLPFGKVVGRCNILADVFAYGSISDDSIAVSNKLWGFPYDVRW